MKRIITLLFCLLIAVSAAGCSMFGTEHIELDKTELSMTVGDTEHISAGKATKVHWESSDDKVASVNGGEVYAKAPGNAVITASLDNGESQRCNVSVADKLIAEVKINSKSLRLEVGKTIQLSATYTPADATKTALSWSSKDSNIAEVDDKGYVTGISEGVTDIVCTSENGVEAACSVTVSSAVTEAPPAPATLAPTQPPTSSSAESATSSSGSSSQQSGGTGGYIFPESSSRYLGVDEVYQRLSRLSGTPVSGSFGQDAVNEIYARNGYVFKSASLNAYYKSQSWYHPDPSFNPANLNDYEQYNIGLLSQY